jgi:hypothetical protein
MPPDRGTQLWGVETPRFSVDREFEASQGCRLHLEGEGTFGGRYSMGGEPGQAIGQSHGLVEQSVGLHHSVNEAEAMGLCRRHAIAGEQIGAGRRDPSQQGPEDGGAIAWYKADADPRLGQVGLLRHKHDVTEKGQSRTGTDRRAVHRRDHRDLKGNEGPEEGTTFVEGCLSELRVRLHLLNEAEVATGAEGVSGSRHDKRSHLGLVGHGTHGGQHRRVERAIERVAAGWAIERKDPDP